MLAPPLIRRAPQEATPVGNITNRANRARHPNALDHVYNTNIVFENLR
jgi:hypothetical protein